MSDARKGRRIPRRHWTARGVLELLIPHFGGGTTTTSGTIAPELSGLFSQSAQRMLNLQKNAPLSDYLGQYPKQVAPMSPQELQGLGLSEGLDTSGQGLNALALKDVMQLPGLAAATPGTAAPDYSNAPSIEDFIAALNSYAGPASQPNPLATTLGPTPVGTTRGGGTDPGTDPGTQPGGPDPGPGGGGTRPKVGVVPERPPTQQVPDRTGGPPMAPPAFGSPTSSGYMSDYYGAPPPPPAPPPKSTADMTPQEFAAAQAASAKNAGIKASDITAWQGGGPAGGWADIGQVREGVRGIMLKNGQKLAIASPGALSSTGQPLDLSGEGYTMVHADSPLLPWNSGVSGQASSTAPPPPMANDTGFAPPPFQKTVGVAGQGDEAYFNSPGAPPPPAGDFAPRQTPTLVDPRDRGTIAVPPRPVGPPGGGGGPGPVTNTTALGNISDWASTPTTSEDPSKFLDSPAIRAALSTFNKTALPTLENQANVMGLGRSTAATQSIANAQGQMMTPLIADEYARQERAGVRRQQATQDQANLLMQMAGGQTAQRQNAIQALMSGGATARGVQQAGSDAAYQDMLRRQALSEQGLFTPFGATASSALGTKVSGK